LVGSVLIYAAHSGLRNSVLQRVAIFGYGGFGNYVDGSRARQ